MEDFSRNIPTIEWNWDSTHYRVGPFHLYGLVEGLGDLVEKLERFPEEKWDTYLIQGTNGSKLFVETGRIMSIQCGTHFVVEGIDIIGYDAKSALSRFKCTFSILQQDQGYAFYVDEQQSLKVIVDDQRDVVIWVIYAYPGYW